MSQWCTDAPVRLARATLDAFRAADLEHLAKREIDPRGIDVAALAAASDGFSGAEIEQAVVATLYASHARGEPVDTAALLEEIRATRPLSVVMAERVGALRAWASGRTVPAN